MTSKNLTPQGPPIHITGVGGVTGYGWGIQKYFDGLASGESAVTLQEGLEGYVPGGKAYLAMVADEGARPGGPTKFVRSVRFAADEAIADAKARGWVPGPEVGVVMATVLGDARVWRHHYQTKGEHINGRSWVRMMPSTMLTMLMKEHGFHGPAIQMGAVCVSGNSAMIMAKTMIDTNMCSDVLLLSADHSALRENLIHFSAIGAAALTTPPLDACRPFQEGSIGFLGGEASVATMLSSRPQGGYASVLGGAITSDAWSAVSIEPSHEQVLRCNVKALEIAGVDASEIVYVNAHGPGTKQCDAAEADVLDTMFPGAVGIYSVKPLVGHCQAAAALVEVLVTVDAFNTGVIHAPRQVAPGHPRLIAGPTPATPAMTLKSSLGFGGNNASIILAPPQN